MNTKEKLTVYARYEPAIGPDASSSQDVVIYRDEAATQFICRWPRANSPRPTRNSRSAIINCFRWNLVWLPAKEVPLERIAA